MYYSAHCVVRVSASLVRRHTARCAGRHRRWLQSAPLPCGSARPAAAPEPCTGSTRRQRRAWRRSSQEPAVGTGWNQGGIREKPERNRKELASSENLGRNQGGEIRQESGRIWRGNRRNTGENEEESGRNLGRNCGTDREPGGVREGPRKSRMEWGKLTEKQRKLKLVKRLCRYSDFSESSLGEEYESSEGATSESSSPFTVHWP